MAPKIWLVVVLLAMVMMVVEPYTPFPHPPPIDDGSWMMASFTSADGDLPAMKTCNNQVGDCIDHDEETMMDSETTRRQLGAYSDMFISYAALRKNQVPCGQRGASYYNCRGNARANPYRRGCTAITHCKRYTK
ncbi:hypothetical protein Dimus_012660 [Dionaea muscipula]